MIKYFGIEIKSLLNYEKNDCIFYDVFIDI